jgi:hypothetical protein
VLATAIGALAIDHHGGGNDDTSLESDLMQYPEPNCGAEVVVGGVSGDIGEIESESNPRCLMAHRVHTAEGIEPSLAVLNIGGDVRRLRVQVVRRRGVNIGREVVEYDHLDPASDALVDDMGANEPASSGDEDSSRRRERFSHHGLTSAA